MQGCASSGNARVWTQAGVPSPAFSPPVTQEPSTLMKPLPKNPLHTHYQSCHSELFLPVSSQARPAVRRWDLLPFIAVSHSAARTHLSKAQKGLGSVLWHNNQCSSFWSKRLKSWQENQDLYRQFVKLTFALVPQLVILTHSTSPACTQSTLCEHSTSNVVYFVG